MSTDERVLAARIFARLVRSDRQLAASGPFYVCLESDLSDDVDAHLRSQYQQDSVAMACYYPRKHVLKVAQWNDAAGRDLHGFDAVDLGSNTSIGMAIDHAMRGNWIPAEIVSTEAVERELTSV